MIYVANGSDFADFVILHDFSCTSDTDVLYF